MEALPPPSQIVNPTIPSETHFRDFEKNLLDLSSEITKKITLYVPTILVLYSPTFKYALSLTTGTARIVTHLNQTVESFSKKQGLETLKDLKKTTIAIIGVATIFFNFRAGELIISFDDALRNLSQTVEQLRNKDYPKAIEGLMQTSASILQISLMLSGTPHIMLAMMLIQASISLYQASLDLKEKDYFSALVKVGLAVFKFNQAYNQYQTIQKTNEFIKKIKEALEKETKDIEESQSNGIQSNPVSGTFSNGPSNQLINQSDRIRESIKDSNHIKDSPLLKEKQEIIQSDADGKKYNFGYYYHGFGKGLVKGMNLQFRSTKINNKNLKEIDFKINHIFRQELEYLVLEMNQFTSNEKKTLLNLSESRVKELKFEQVPFEFGPSETFGFAYKISLQGLGNILIGSSPEIPSLYNLIRVQIEKNKTLFDVHEMLSFLNLQDALKVSSPQDIERLKIGHLFRIYNPKEAYILERQAKFFTLSIDELKKEIVSQVPSMLSLMNQYLNKMKTVEIFPGKLRYSVPDIAKKVYDLGGRFLITTITGDQSPSELSKRVTSILKMGLLSSETRLRNGIQKKGLSASSDFYTGGSDSVFTQLLTKKAFDHNLQLKDLYHGNIRILFPLDNLNSGTYQYQFDNYGERSSAYYQNRANIFSFTKQEQQKFDHNNEVMLKEATISKAVKIFVSDKKVLNIVLNSLRQMGFVKKIQGKEMVNGIPLNKFLVVANKLSPALVN